MSALEWILSGALLFVLLLLLVALAGNQDLAAENRALRRQARPLDHRRLLRDVRARAVRSQP